MCFCCSPFAGTFFLFLYNFIFSEEILWEKSKSTAEIKREEKKVKRKLNFPKKFYIKRGKNEANNFLTIFGSNTNFSKLRQQSFMENLNKHKKSVSPDNLFI